MSIDEKGLEAACYEGWHSAGVSHPTTYRIIKAYEAAKTAQTVSVDLATGAQAIDPNAYAERYKQRHLKIGDCSAENFRKRRAKAIRQATRCAEAWGLAINEKGSSYAK